MISTAWKYILSFNVLIFHALALSLDVTDETSICDAGATILAGEWNYYQGTTYGGTVGMFDNPYYWWHAGEAFGGILDFWYYCQSDNDTLKTLISDAMYHQAGESYNLIPSNQSLTEGNDDQGVWAITVMAAVEKNFTDAGSNGWLYIVQAAYNSMVARWDSANCGGGLRWQIFTWNSGYNYKNSIANGCLFHLAARLARYEQNSSYVTVAEQVWDWMNDVGFMTNADSGFLIYDGADTSYNCTDLTTSQWSYTYGIFMAGCAYLYNYTGDDKWSTRAQDILETSSYFFNGSIMYEHTCAASGKCNNDQRSFRSIFSRMLGLTAYFIPETKTTIMNYLKESAAGAAESCSGGTDGVTCGQNWAYGGWDGFYGLGEQMSALECIQNLLIDTKPGPLTNDTGGTSTGNVNAGLDSLTDSTNKNVITVTGGSKAGAGILTAAVLALLIAGSVWMII